MEIDIRVQQDTPLITKIIFADKRCSDGQLQGHYVALNYSRHYVQICDTEDVIIINSKTHAENLIKALERAIDEGALR